MSTTYKKLLELTFPEVRERYSERNTMLYALSLGVGNNPVAPEQLRLVYEENLCALPTLCVTLAHPGFWPKELNSGLDFTRIVHGEQRLQMHQTLPCEGEVIGRSRIRDVIDKGEGRGALVYFERTLLDAATMKPLCTMEQTLFCRGDGGMGGSGHTPPPVHEIPDRHPDVEISHELAPQSALLYRLNGDMNPLHANPEIATRAGFERPILQGLATYGVAGLAAISALGDDQPARLAGLNARFTAPVYPGETLLTQIWRQGETEAALRVIVAKRGVVAIDNGKVTLR